jgi:protein associated with RNAse G/E
MSPLIAVAHDFAVAVATPHPAIDKLYRPVYTAGVIDDWHVGSAAGKSAVPMQIGDRIQVRAYKADGTCYRWWDATVEAVESDAVVTITPPGHRVEDIHGGWVSQHAIRSWYWLDRWYCLLEVYAPDGRLEEIYVNVNSPAEIVNAGLRFTDYELDVSRELPQGARIVDEDEFAEAADEYGYSETFQQACYQVAREAVEVANRWVARGMPARGSSGAGE